MARYFQKKERNSQARKRKPVMVIAAEGQNVTELQYLLSFRSQHGKYAIHPHRTGHDTDPFGLLKSTEKYWLDNQLSEELGDKAYILMDIDCSDEKAKKMGEAIRSSKYPEFILSNPAFEVWFLFHFEQTTHVFFSTNELIRRLKKYIPDYEKNLEVYTRLKPFITTALQNAEFAEKHHKKLGSLWPSGECSPMTDIPTIIRQIM